MTSTLGERAQACDIQWRIHLSSSPEDVYRMLSTDAGRARFWAEEAVEEKGFITFLFPNGITWRAEILEKKFPHRFRIIYYGGTITTFDLRGDGSGGTDLLLTDEGVPPEYQPEVLPGWVSVLMALKAAADFHVDLRNHDPSRTWDQGYADN